MLSETLTSPGPSQVRANPALQSRKDQPERPDAHQQPCHSSSNRNGFPVTGVVALGTAGTLTGATTA